nr:hypothetical protein [Moraxella sp. CTOTU48841]
MAKENLVDSFYTLGLDTVGDKTGYKKIPHLQKCAPISQEKVKDEITDTDDTQEEFAIVNFKKNGDVEFEIVYDPKDPTHMKLDKMFEDNSYGYFEYFLTQAKQGKTFDAQLMKWEEVTETKTQKLRKKGTLTISNVTPITTSLTQP